ncbi:hypothetical protein [Dictyobacter kobayashii]|uniref:Cytochrome P450 n=1 Tax=Dictyobacter kobayashii TaxID=2014872 RepID=A0A402ARB1_9CHLR|nr:hypothetical protein [Dictyobacter kobayashii]GCE21646.1 hypothetical protein KDK_54460 [Dictyobacter kobayashii]
MQKQTNRSSRPTSVSTQPVEERLEGFAWFAYMRANHPVVYDDQMQVWHAFKYDDVYQVINDPETFSSENVPTFSHNVFLRDTIVSQDPPIIADCVI